jgi:hypothetical protein
VKWLEVHTLNSNPSTERKTPQLTVSFFFNKLKLSIQYLLASGDCCSRPAHAKSYQDPISTKQVSPGGMHLQSKLHRSHPHRRIMVFRQTWAKTRDPIQKTSKTPKSVAGMIQVIEHLPGSMRW